MPTPRMSKNSTREKRTRARQEVTHLRSLRDCLEMGAPVEADDDVTRAVSDYLVRDVRVSTADVLRACESH